MFRFSIDRYLALTICPTAVWGRNATTVAGVQSGNSGTTSAQLNKPTDVYIDRDNIMYVLDTGNYRLQRVFPNSTIVTTVVNSTNGTGLNQFAYSEYNMA